MVSLSYIELASELTITRGYLLQQLQLIRWDPILPNGRFPQGEGWEIPGSSLARALFDVDKGILDF